MGAVAAIFQYQEFFLAGVIGVFFLLSSRPGEAFHCPGWWSRPAIEFVSRLPERYVLWMRSALMMAGWRSNYSYGDFVGLKCFLPLVSLLLAFFLPSLYVLPIFIICWFAPDLVLRIVVKRRQQSIRQSLPRTLDLMVLCVDAGLGLDATLQRLSLDSESIATELNDELTLLLRDILLGMDRERAYEELFNRTGVDELKMLGSALNQANKLGLSIVKILRSQSEFIRKRHSQKAEEAALKMPVYMAFPLWFCIMPSLMLLVLGPSLLAFYHQLAPRIGP